MHPRLAVQERDPEDAEEMQAHDDDDRARDIAEDVEVGADPLADVGGACAERDEHRGKAQHEGEGGAHDAPARLGNGAAAGQFVEAQAGKETQVRRHQGQDAGRYEGQQAGQECAGQGDVEHQFAPLE